MLIKIKNRIAQLICKHEPLVHEKNYKNGGHFTKIKAEVEAGTQI